MPQNNSYNPYNPQIGAGQLPGGIWGSQNRAYVRNVQPNELVSDQLNNITASNSPMIQQARQAAMAQAAARGNMNGSYAAGNAQGAAIRAALPIAQGNADAFQKAASENEQWLNQQQMNIENNGAQLDAASIGASAQRDSANINNQGALQRQRENLGYEGEQAGLGRAFQQYMSQMQQGYGLDNMAAQNYFTQQNMGLNNAYSQNAAQQAWARDIYGNTLGSVLGTTLSSPDIFGNPDAAFGMINGYTNFAGNLLNRYLGGG